MKKIIFLLFGIICLFIFTAPAQAGGDSFTQKDRELLIRLDERLNQIDKRFNQIDKRFEQVDKRFYELREDMNKRFEQVDKRFESLQNLMMAIVGAFAAIVAVTISFAIWDRRSMMRPFEYRIKEMDNDFAENRKKIDKITEVFKELAKNDEKLAAVLRSISLL